MILTICFSASTRSWAEPPATTQPTETLRRAKIAKGTRAPFSGILVSPAYLATTVVNLEKQIDVLKAKLKAAEERAAVQAEATKRVADARITAEVDKTAACHGDLLRREKLYEDALKRCDSRSWFRSPTLWTVIGATVGAGVCGLGVGLGR